MVVVERPRMVAPFRHPRAEPRAPSLPPVRSTNRAPAVQAKPRRSSPAAGLRQHRRSH
jgi:hypothetical protein